MKIAPKQAGDFLRAPDKTTAGLLLYGPDSGMVRERARLAARAILGEKHDDMAIAELSDDQLKADPALLADELCAASLLTGRRVILVRDASDKLTKTLEEMLGNLPPGAHYFVLCAGELSPRSSLRSLAESHAKLGALACYKDEAMDLAAIIRKRFEDAGIRATRDVTDYLQQQLGNDRYVTYSELDKIVLYLGEEKQLSLEVAMQLVGNNKDVDLDAICMATLSGDPVSAEKALTQAWREGVQPVAILRSLIRQLHRLYGLRLEMDGGKPLDQAMASLRPPIFFRHTQAVAEQVKRRSLPELTRLLAAAQKAEMDVKSGTLPPQLVTGQLILLMARRGGQSRAA